MKLFKHIIFLIFALSLCTCRLKGQVSLQTGSATFSIPIYSFTDNQSSLTLPITLNYNSGNGLKVDEVASDVGQGWGLMAGGKIVRMQNGEPDDQKALAGTWSDITKYPNGYYFSSEDPQLGVPKNGNKYPIFKNQDQKYKQHNSISVDRELDYFLLNVNGITATFVLKKGTNEGIFLGHTPMKISVEFASGNFQSFTITDLNNFSSSARTMISAFVLTDENGIEYRFSQKGYNQIMRQSSSNRSFTLKVNPPKKRKKRDIHHESYFAESNTPSPYTINEWHLTSIKDKFNPTRVINFYYKYRKYDNIRQGFEYQTVNTTKLGIGGSSKDYLKVIGKKASQITPVLDSVSCPNGYSIGFKYSTIRVDLEGGKMLDSIMVRYKGKYLHKHILQHTYVMYTRYGTPVSGNEEQKRAARLYLIAVTKQGPELKDQDKPYQFDYYLGGLNRTDFVPPPFFATKDIWGFYDGYLSLLGTAADNPNNVSPTYRSYCLLGSYGLSGNAFPSFDEGKRLTFKDEGLTRVKSGYAKNGLLKSIIYPSGGQLVYEYNQNRTTMIGATQETEVGGVHVSKTTTYDGGYGSNCSNGIATTYNYIMPGGASSLWGVENPLNKIKSNSEYKGFEFFWDPFNIKKLFNPIKCNYRYKYPGIPQDDFATQIKGLEAIMSSTAASLISDAASLFSTINNFRTIAGAVSHATKATVALAWIGIAMDVLAALFDIYMECIRPAVVKTTEVTTWFNRDFRANNPLPVQYKRVEVVEVSAMNGKTVSEFTSIDDYAIWHTPQSQDGHDLFDMRQRYGPWFYGLPKKTTVYDAEGRKVREVENTYTTQCSPPVPDGGPPPTVTPGAMVIECGFSKLSINQWSCNSFTKNAKPVKSDDWLGYATLNPSNDYTGDLSTDEIRVGKYDLFTGHLKLATTVEREYQQYNDAIIQSKTTNYYYGTPGTLNDNFQPIVIEEILPSGLNSQKHIQYNNLYNPDGSNSSEAQAMQVLAANNVYNLPVRTTLKTKMAGTSAYYYDVIEERTEYGLAANGTVRPMKSKVRRVANPVSDIVGIPEVTTMQYFYNARGILVNAVDEGGRSSQKLYEHDDQFVVANVIGLKQKGVSGSLPFYETVAYTSFEEPPSNGFNFSGTRPTGVCITGTKYYQLISTTPITLSTNINTSTTISPNRSYIVSFWATAPVTVSSGTLAKSGPVRKGFTYYEYNIAAGVASISISGTASIDEVRLYPKGSLITTTAYDPLLGKTSEADASSRVINYNYDSRGRLQFVRDEDGNITQMQEYGERATHEKCPVTYYNHAIYELVQRRNCGTNYTGGWVEYVIPANTYSSSVSQAHADMLAELALTANAQAYANSNGSCIYVYKNTAISHTFYKQDCDWGYEGSAYTYTVPAAKYYSTISQQDADEQAYDDLLDHGQSIADSIGTCNLITTPQWVADENAPMRCKTVNGHNVGITEVQVRNVNPNSSTYNDTMWLDMDENILGCNSSHGVTVVGQNLTYYPMTVSFSPPGSGTPLYTFNVSTSGASEILGTIPSGIYDVEISPQGFMYSHYYFEVNGLYSSGFGSQIISNLNLTVDNLASILTYY